LGEIPLEKKLREETEGVGGVAIFLKPAKNLLFSININYFKSLVQDP
jgi:hypothetical protein